MLGMSLESRKRREHLSEEDLQVEIAFFDQLSSTTNLNCAEEPGHH